jgi:hypothetical protein
MAACLSSHRRLRPCAALYALMLAVALVLQGLPSTASQGPAGDPGAICDAVAARVSRESGVPLSVLQAITRTETGRRRDGRVQPWPWTVNMEGRGVWFDTPDEARAYAYEHYQRGARSFDVGCFQLNFRWHGENFASIEEMFDPLANGRYAARFLSDLYAELGDWSRAAGAYHSRTPTFANRYRAIFDRHRAAVEGQPPPETAALDIPSGGTGERAPRVNTFPLLQAGAGLTPGSLVPLAGQRPAGSLFGTPPATPDDGTGEAEG